MITKKDISFRVINTEWTDAAYVSRFMTRLELSVFQQAVAEELRRDPNMAEVIKQSSIAAIEHKLYGEAQELLSGLEYVAMASCSKLDHATKLRGDFAKLRDLLTIK